MRPPKPNLDILISELEKEQRALKKMIKAAAAEHDNLIVYHHSEALLDLNSRLRVLCSFRDPDFEQKENIQRQIILLKRGNYWKNWKPELRERSRKRHMERARDLEEQLKKLAEKPLPVATSGTHFIDDALAALFNKQWHSFKLVLGEYNDQRVWLEFKTSKNLLIVRFKAPFDDERDFVLDNRVPQPLKAAGFEYNSGQKKFERSFDFVHAAKIPEVKAWLAKFIIDDTHQYGRGQRISLEYKA